MQTTLSTERSRRLEYPFRCLQLAHLHSAPWQEQLRSRYVNNKMKNQVHSRRTAAGSGTAGLGYGILSSLHNISTEGPTGDRGTYKLHVCLDERYRLGIFDIVYRNPGAFYTELYTFSVAAEGDRPRTAIPCSHTLPHRGGTFGPANILSRSFSAVHALFSCLMFISLICSENSWSKKRISDHKHRASTQRLCASANATASIRLMLLIIPVWAPARWGLASVAESFVCLVLPIWNRQRLGWEQLGIRFP